MYRRDQTPEDSGLPLYHFRDGYFAFVTAQYGSWANDKRIVFRVRYDTSPEARAQVKGILYWDRIVPASLQEITAWLESHEDFPVIQT